MPRFGRCCVITIMHAVEIGDRGGGKLFGAGVVKAADGDGDEGEVEEEIEKRRRRYSVRDTTILQGMRKRKS